MNFLVTFRQESHRFQLQPGQSLNDLRLELHRRTGVSPQHQKLLHKALAKWNAKTAEEEAAVRLETLFLPPATSATSATPALATPQEHKITLVGSLAEEIETVHRKDQVLEIRKQVHARARTSSATSGSAGSIATLSTSGTTTLFARHETLSGAGYAEEARAKEILRRLEQDRGVVAIMNQNQWSVGLLFELCPVRRADILGVNVNRGESIGLRLRTDGLDGFRHYNDIRKVLLHELTHMVHGEHDHAFWKLYRQLERDVVSLDWAAHGGRTVAAGGGTEFYQPPDEEDTERMEDLGLVDHGAVQGGTFVLGGKPLGEGDTRPMREILAEAAQKRLNMNKETPPSTRK